MGSQMLGEERVSEKGVVSSVKGYRKIKRIQKMLFTPNDYFLSSTFKIPLSGCLGKAINQFTVRY